jgi:hypothetical protein
MKSAKVTAGIEHDAPSHHHRWMAKGVASKKRTANVAVCQRQLDATQHAPVRVDKFVCAAEHSDLRLRFHEVVLLSEPLVVCDIVAIHARNEFTSRMV